MKLIPSFHPYNVCNCQSNQTKAMKTMHRGCVIHVKSFPRSQLQIKTLCNVDALHGKKNMNFSSGCEKCTLVTYDPFLIVPSLSRIKQANCFEKQ